MFKRTKTHTSPRKWTKIACVACAISGFFTFTSTLTANVSAQTAQQEAAPPTAVRAKLPPTFLGGVIEGFYGPSWNLSDTTHMLQFMDQHGMNTFLYAPKYDPYERSQWRLRYPSGPWSTITQFIQSAQHNHQNFVYSISPGLDITYESQSDRNDFVRKIDQLRSAGVHTFMLALDDIPEVLKREDATRYHNDFARAQSDFANAIWKREHQVDPKFRLIMAQTVYYGTKNCTYWQSLKKYLIPQVDLIWTGPWVLSESITANQVREVEAYMGHRLVIWDNYPVNDFTYVVAKKPELFLGPLTGRDPNVVKLVDGYLFNPMYQARASEIPLWSCADFLRDPVHYQPSTSIARAIAAIGGPAGSALQVMVTQASSRYYDHLQPQQLKRDMTDFWSSRSKSNLAETSLYADFTSMSRVNQELHDSLPDKRLYTEIAPWATKLSSEGTAGMLAIELMQRAQTHSVTNTDKHAFRTMVTSLSQDTHAISGTLIQEFLQRVMTVIQA